MYSDPPEIANDEPDAHLERIEALLRRLERFENPPPDLPSIFNDEEQAGLRELLDYREELLRDLRYHRARRLLRSHWMGVIDRYRGFVVSAAALLTFIIAVREDLKEILTWLLQK